MGTRSITEVRSRWEGKENYKTNAVIYRHWDGYLDGHGQDLLNFLNNIHVVNGISSRNPEGRIANGPGRLASMLVNDLFLNGHDPDLIGEVSDMGQEYHYVVDVDFGMDGGTIKVTVYDGPMTAFGFGEECTNKIFSGSVAEYSDFLKKQEE